MVATNRNMGFCFPRRTGGSGWEIRKKIRKQKSTWRRTHCWLSYESRKNPQMTRMTLLIRGFHTEEGYWLSSESVFNSHKQRDSTSVVIQTNRNSNPFEVQWTILLLDLNGCPLKWYVVKMKKKRWFIWSRCPSYKDLGTPHTILI